MADNIIDIMRRMVNLHDYNEYVDLCSKAEIGPRDLQYFYLVYGGLNVGRIKSPELDWQDVYKKMIQDINNPESDQLQVSSVKVGKSSCCGNDKKKKSPNIIQKSINLVKSGTEHLATGSRLCDKTEYARRINICSQCDRLIPGKISYECIDCGCLMGIKGSWAEQKCKLNKW